MKIAHTLPSALLVSITLLLTACADVSEPASGAESSTGASLEDSPTAEETAPTEEPTLGQPELNQRGDLPKSFGDTAGATLEGDPERNWLEFSVVDVREVECAHPSGVEELEGSGGIAIAAELEGHTTAAMAEATPEYQPEDNWLDFNFDWVGFDSQGQRMNDVHTNVTYNCLETSQVLPHQIGPGETFNGVVVLEVTDESGEIAFRPGWLEGGWNWSYDLDSDTSA